MNSLFTKAAIKVLDTQLTSHTVEWFLTEARTIARLVHPHIVRILDFAVQDLVPFLLLDYAPNASLRQHHPQRLPLPLPTTIAYVKQVPQALQYPHNEKLIHPDVKPENMLLFAFASADWTVHVWDTITNQKLFTFQHTAPVQVMAWSPNGKSIASGGGDPLIQVWVAP